MSAEPTPKHGFLDVAEAKMPVAFEARVEDLRALKFGEEHAP